MNLSKDCVFHQLNPMFCQTPDEIIGNNEYIYYICIKIKTTKI